MKSRILNAASRVAHWIILGVSVVVLVGMVGIAGFLLYWAAT